MSAHTGNCAYAGAFEFCNFEAGFEHVFDKSGVLEDLVGVAGEFEFLYYLGGFVYVEYDTCCCDPETGRLVRERLDANESGVRGDQWAIEGTETMHVFGGVLQHAIPCP